MVHASVTRLRLSHSHQESEAFMFARRTFAACCVLALPCGACLAQTTFAADQYYDNRWYITPFGAYVHPDGDRNADNGWGGGVGIGKPISPSWNIELRAQYEE